MSTDPRATPDGYDTVVLFSGGLDSTVALALVVENGDRAATLSVDYGQRHGGRELEAAARIADHYGVPHRVLDLSAVRDFLAAGALTSSAVEVPEGHYAADTMADTVVPGRNLLMLAAASSYAARLGARRVVTAVHAGDHYVYPDCRPPFIEAAARASKLGTEGHGDVDVVAPFVGQSKADIARLGAELGAPLHLSWSCYAGGTIQCGRCGTCVERIEAMHLAGVRDATRYADDTYWATAVRDAG